MHEVWDEGGELYIAMEFIEGQTLAQWQQAPRSVREILDIYLQAGRSHAMPPANLSYMEAEERAAIAAWYRAAIGG